jgi:hypothetical protein
MGRGADSLLSAGWGVCLAKAEIFPHLARRPSMEQGRTYDPQTKKPPGEARRLSISLLRAG